jgi:hypothetical protein
MLELCAIFVPVKKPRIAQGDPTMPSFFHRLTCLVLMLSLFASGCAIEQSAFVGNQHQVVSDQTMNIGHGALAFSDSTALEKTGRKERRAWRWAVFATIVVVIVVVDVLLLPAYHRSNNSFPCTRTVYVWCD